MRLGVAFRPAMDFISLSAWFWVKQNSQYAVDATAGVYNLSLILICFDLL
jgi:hypothetical protein